MNDFISIYPQNKINQLKKVSVFLICFLCCFIPLRSVLELYTFSYIKLIPDIIITSLFIWYATTIKFRFRFLLQDWLFLGFIILSFISSIFINQTGVLPFIFQTRSIGLYYVFYFVIRNFKLGKHEFISIVNILQIITLVLFVFGLFEKITFKTFLFPESIANEIIYASNFTRVYSLFLNPNTYSLFLNFVFFLSVFCQISYERKTNPLFYGVLLTSIFMSMSRSGIIFLVVGSVIGGLCFFIKYKKKVPTVKILVNSIIILSIGFIGYFIVDAGSVIYYNNVLINSEKNSDKISNSVNIGTSDRFDNTLTDQELEESATSGRIYSIKKGLEIIPNHLVLGTGFGTFGSAASMNYKPDLAEKYDLPFPFYADNEYIKVLVENGILGSAIFISFIFSIVFYYRKDFFKVFICFMFAWFGLFFNIFEVQIGAMLFWSFLSMEHFPVFQK